MWLRSLVNVFTVNIILALDVGEECVPSRDVSSGICTVITDCEVAIRSIRNKNHHHLTRCGWRGDLEVLCCPQTSEKFGGSSTESTSQPSQRILSVADQECQKIIASSIIPLNLNIIGGEIASRGEFPHMAALGYPKDDGYGFDCGGSIIASRYILTAAHCVDTLDRIEPNIVRVGVVDLGGSQLNDETDYRIEEIIRHPDYLKREKYHDLAIIRLEKPISFNSNQSPACLYTNPEDPDIPLTITGWGTTNTATNARSNLLLKANVTVVAREKCGQSYTNWRKLPRGISDDQLCAGDPDGLRDTCQGDSGGPLQGQTSRTDEVYRIVGVTSFGRGCGSPVPGVYTRLSHYLPWIESVVWPN